MLLSRLLSLDTYNDAATGFDLLQLSSQYIRNGADSIGVRFNLRVKGREQDVYNQLVALLASKGCYVRQLNQLYCSEDQGLYFEYSESVPALVNTQRLLQPSKSRVSWLAGPQSLKARFDGFVQNLKVQSPDLCGNIIVDGGDTSHLELVLLGKAQLVGSFSLLLRGHASSKEYKVFSLGFLVNRPKPLCIPETDKQLLACGEMKTEFSLTVNYAGELEWLESLAEKYNLRISGGLLGHECFPLCAGQLGFHSKLDGQSLLDIYKREYEDNCYALVLRLPERSSSIELFHDIVGTLVEKRATTGVTCSLRKAMKRFESTYLPSYPLANTETAGISLRDDLSTFGKG